MLGELRTTLAGTMTIRDTSMYVEAGPGHATGKYDAGKGLGDVTEIRDGKRDRGHGHRILSGYGTES